MSYCKHRYRYSKSRKVHICEICGYYNYNYTKTQNALKIGLPCVGIVIVGILIFLNSNNNSLPTEPLETIKPIETIEPINKPQTEESEPIKLVPTPVIAISAGVTHGFTTQPAEPSGQWVRYGGNLLYYSELELQIHQLINNERQKYGLQPLAYDNTLSIIAREHSRDMEERNYFAHDTPEGIEPADRGYKYGYFDCGDRTTIQLSKEYDQLAEEYDRLVEVYEPLVAQFEASGSNDYVMYNKLQKMYSEIEQLYNKLEPMRIKLNSAIDQEKIFGGISENLFLNNLYDTIWYTNDIPTSYDWNTPEEIARSTVDGWMDSQGHRKNILTPYYTSEGIGVDISWSDHRVYITQNFC